MFYNVIKINICLKEGLKMNKNTMIDEIKQMLQDINDLSLIRHIYNIVSYIHNKD